MLHSKWARPQTWQMGLTCTLGIACTSPYEKSTLQSTPFLCVCKTGNCGMMIKLFFGPGAHMLYVSMASTKMQYTAGYKAISLYWGSVYLLNSGRNVWVALSTLFIGMISGDFGFQDSCVQVSEANSCINVHPNSADDGLSSRATIFCNSLLIWTKIQHRFGNINKVSNLQSWIHLPSPYSHQDFLLVPMLGGHDPPTSPDKIHYDIPKVCQLHIPPAKRQNTR